MSIKREEITKYFRPLLKRTTCRFSRFRDSGLISEEQYEQLRLANTIGSREPDAHLRFARQLQRTNGSFKKGIEEILTGGNHETQEDHLTLLRKLQEQLISHGIYAQLNRPATAGMILSTADACGVPAFLVISESTNGNRHIMNGGRTTLGKKDSVDSVVIFATQAVARVAEILHMWFSVFGSKEPDVEARLAAQRTESLSRYCDIASGHFSDPADIPVEVILSTIANRAILNRFRRILGDVHTPEEFLLRAAEEVMQSEITHEAAHVQERKANGLLSGDIPTAELLAYMAQGAYCGGGYAFRFFLNRSQAPERMIPELYADIRKKGIHAMLEDEGYLDGWAGRILMRACMEKLGKRVQSVFNPIKLRSLAASPLLDESQVPMLEKAMYNPSLISIEELAG